MVTPIRIGNMRCRCVCRKKRCQLSQRPVPETSPVDGSKKIRKRSPPGLIAMASAFAKEAAGALIIVNRAPGNADEPFSSMAPQSSCSGTARELRMSGLNNQSISNETVAKVPVTSTKLSRIHNLNPAQLCQSNQRRRFIANSCPLITSYSAIAQQIPAARRESARCAPGSRSPRTPCRTGW